MSDDIQSLRTQDAGFTQNLVLIAEDDEPIALALSLIVEDAGYKTLLAVNGRQALDYARAQHPALIITDLMMPHMTGKEFIAALRQDVNLRLPPIIVMSAADRSFVEEVGADAILRKPFDLDHVDQLLQRFLPSVS